MERVVNEASRSALGTLGEMLAGGGQALFGQAQSLAGDMQRRIAGVVPLGLQGEVDRLAERVRDLEAMLANGGRELVAPVRALALGAFEVTATVRAGLEDAVARIERLERRLIDLEARLGPPEAR